MLKSRICQTRREPRAASLLFQLVGQLLEQGGLRGGRRGRKSLNQIFTDWCEFLLLTISTICGSTVAAFWGKKKEREF